MSFADWDNDEVQKVREGLLLLGWRADFGNLTSEDAWVVRDVANAALASRAQGKFTRDVCEELASRVFAVISFPVMNIDERTTMTSGPYKDSTLFGPLVPLIDESILCYYRGYYTAALATLFIVCEQYLRSLLGWKPEPPEPSFSNLRKAVRMHPESQSRDEAEAILGVIYSHYEEKSPTDFFFNRHGLLHGLRGSKNVDRMNCVRMLLLFDLLCFSEGLTRGLVYTEDFYHRHAAYKACVRLGTESQLMLRS